MESMSVKKLKAAMIQRNYNISELARRSEIQANLISRWLKREKVSVLYSTIGKLCKALNVSPESLLSEEVV